MENLSKLWITDYLSVYTANDSNNSVVLNFPKIYQCDATYLLLKNQVISLNEFMFLCLSVEELGLEEVTVKNDNGTVVLFDKLAEQFPNVKEIY
uniref:Uncharacterized protein n=1 Tax=Panagrolaimus superbus TaxID=310955 RepID=A0A914Y7I1_9BILA